MQRPQQADAVRVASGLSILRRSAESRVVIDGRRRFPTPRAGVAYLPDMRILTLDEAAAVIAPRLRQLAETEPAPRILPRVLQAWELSVTES